jgi:hypothetical protein
MWWYGYEHWKQELFIYLLMPISRTKGWFSNVTEEKILINKMNCIWNNFYTWLSYTELEDEALSAVVSYPLTGVSYKDEALSAVVSYPLTGVSYAE